MYKVNLSSNVNCSSILLQHSVDHPEEEYIDSLNVSHPCRNDAQDSDPECLDYLQIYYGSQSRVLCREELAELEMRLVNVTSFVAIYWSDATHDPDATSSFNLRAECDI